MDKKYNNYIYDDFKKESILRDKRIDIEHEENWGTIIDNIPYLSGFKPEWAVKIVPPKGGAVARFVVKFNDVTVSIYLDWYSRLGCMSIPYYEIWDYTHGSQRFPLEETKEMMETIDKMLNKTYVDKKENLIDLIDNVDFSELDRIMYYDEASGQYNSAYDEFVKVLTKCQEVTK